MTARALRRTFVPGSPVLDRVDLDIRRQEFLALLGPSGCGKSTLLRLIAGIDRQDSGTIELAAPRQPGSVSIVFQDPTLLPWREVVDNVALPLRIQGVPLATARRRALAELESVGLAAAAHRLPHELSGGMRMRAALARALVSRPELLLLDEPFAALDEPTRHQLQSELRALCRRHPMTVVLVTHSAAEAVFLADRILLLSRIPARITGEYTVPLPDPRDETVRNNPLYNDLTAKVRAAIAAGHSEPVP